MSLLLLGADLARAASPEPRAARLEYRAASGCPGESVLARDVAARLGYDPFHEDAPLHIRVLISGHGRAFSGRIEITDRENQGAGKRELPQEEDCTELVQAAAFAVALAIDPARATGVASTTGAAPTTAEPSAPPPAPAPPPPAVTRAPSAAPARRAEDPLRVAVGVAALASALRLPGGVAGGGGLFVSVGRRRWLASLEGHFELPFGEARSDGHAVSAVLVGATVAPCLRFGIVSGCVLAELGSFQGTGSDIDIVRRDTTLFVGAGARVGVELALSRRFFLRPTLDLVAPITRTTLRLARQPVWTTPPVSLIGGLALGIVI